MTPPDGPPNRFGAFEHPVVFTVTTMALMLVGFVLWFGVLRRIEPVPSDRLLHIIESGILKVATRNQVCCLQQKDGHRSGFELELARLFAAHLGVRVEMHLYKSWAAMQADLSANHIDLIAARTAITPTRRRQVDFSKGYAQDNLQWVVNKKDPEIGGESDLKHQVVHLLGNSAAHEYAMALQKKHFGLRIVAHRKTAPAELVRQVASRDIPAALVTGFTAKRFQRYYPQLNVAFSVNPQLDIGWAVAKGQKRLLAAIDQFLTKSKDQGVIKQLQKHHFSYLDAHGPYAVNSSYKALSAYNAGVGHMLDARNLARKMDLDPNRWASMVIALPLLSQYRYFQDTIYGYCYGKQPLKYVRRIRSYFDILNYHHPGP